MADQQWGQRSRCTCSTGRLMYTDYYCATDQATSTRTSWHSGNRVANLLRPEPTIATDRALHYPNGLPNSTCDFTKDGPPTAHPRQVMLRGPQVPRSTSRYAVQPWQPTSDAESAQRTAAYNYQIKARSGPPSRARAAVGTATGKSDVDQRTITCLPPTGYGYLAGTKPERRVDTQGLLHKPSSRATPETHKELHRLQAEGCVKRTLPLLLLVLLLPLLHSDIAAAAGAGATTHSTSPPSH